jgi:acyl carrier protein
MSTTNRTEVRGAVLRALSSVAPEADLATLDAKQSLREQLDIDSMDFLNFVIALHGALGVNVPERDYAKLATLDSCVAYLSGKPQ